MTLESGGSNGVNERANAAPASTTTLLTHGRAEGGLSDGRRPRPGGRQVGESFGTSAGGITLSSLGDEDRGVLRLEDQAPEGASSAVVMYGGQEHRVPVRYGHFLFVAWNAPSAFEDPILIGVDWTGRRQI
jgi:hypothetical protein